MDNVSEVILFVSSNSSACVPCVEFVNARRAAFEGVRVSVVRLDTAAQRQLAKNGSDLIAIRVVPTLIVIYADGNLSAHQGYPKAAAWLSQFVEAGAPVVEKDAEPESRGGLYDDLAQKKRTGPARPKRRKRKTFKPRPARDDPAPDDEPGPLDAPEEDAPEDDTPEDDETELLDPGSATASALASGGPLSSSRHSGGSSPMQSVRELAARMEREAGFR